MCLAASAFFWVRPGCCSTHNAATNINFNTNINSNFNINISINRGEWRRQRRRRRRWWAVTKVGQNRYRLVSYIAHGRFG
jgi:hypothetical protein